VVTTTASIPKRAWSGEGRGEENDKGEAAAHLRLP
jgi:hypothetical protein